MKPSILILILFISITSLAQQNSDGIIYDSWTFSPYTEISHQKSTYFTPGLRLKRVMPCGACPPVGIEYQIATDIGLDSQYNFNLRTEASVYMFFIAGVAVQYWTFQEKGLITLGPKTGINLYVFELNYSYNFHLSKNFDQIGKHRFGVKLDLRTIYNRENRKKKSS